MSDDTESGGVPKPCPKCGKSPCKCPDKETEPNS